MLDLMKGFMAAVIAVVVIRLGIEVLFAAAGI
jgi:hypothetical protein